MAYSNFSPSNPRHYSARAKELAKTGQINAAIELLESGLERFPDNIIFINQLSHLCRRGGYIDKSLTYLHRSHSIDPRDMVTITTLGNVYAQQGKYAEAEKILAEGRRVDPGNMVTITTLGNVYAQQGKYAEAEKILAEGRRIDPGNMVTITTLGNVYAQQGKYAEAEKILAEGRRSDPGNMVTITTLGNLYMNLGRYADCNKLLQQNMPQGKNDSSFLYLIGKLAFIQHAPELARRAAYAALHVKIERHTAILYIACAELDEPMREKLQRHFGDEEFRSLLYRGSELRKDASLLEQIEPRFSPSTSSVLAELPFMRPVNLSARRETRPYNHD